MVIHCTRKLAAKLADVAGVPLEESSPLGSWHANLYFVDRRQCVLFCHDEYRYCLFLPGLRAPLFVELCRWHRELFLASLAVEGVEEMRLKRVELALGQARFDTATNRSVLASFTNARLDLDGMVYRVPNVLDLNPLAVSQGSTNGRRRCSATGSSRASACWSGRRRFWRGNPGGVSPERKTGGLGRPF